MVILTADVLHHLGQAAAILLLLELFVVLLVFAAVAGGLAFGLHWVRGKTDWAFQKADYGLRQGEHYVEVGLEYAAKPLLLTGRAVGTVQGTMESLRQEVQKRQAARDIEPGTVAARPMASVPAPPIAVPTTVPAVPQATPAVEVEIRG